MSASGFAAKLGLVLRALSMSRGRLAVELGVSKPLVGRWVSGAVTPSAHNLDRLTRLVAARREGFTLVDWDREPADLALLFGVDPALALPESAASPFLGLSPQILQVGRATTAARGGTYEGFWRLTRPAVIAPGRFCRDYGLLRRGDNGLLEFRLGNPEMSFAGWALPIEGMLFAVASDTIGHLPTFLIMNGVSMPKIMLLDGMILTALNALRVPAAYPIMLERIGDLSGDRAVDDAHAAELMKMHPQFVDDDEVPDPVRNHLLRDVGPAAAAAGGSLLLTAAMSPTLNHMLAFLSSAQRETATRQPATQAADSAIS